MIRTVARVENPGEVRVAITMTMPIDRWNELVDQLEDDFPSWELRAHIRMVLGGITSAVTDEAKFS